MPRGLKLRIIQLIARLICFALVAIATWLAAKGVPVGDCGTTTKPSEEITHFAELAAAALGAVLFKFVDLYLHKWQDSEKKAAPTGMLFPDEQRTPGQSFYAHDEFDRKQDA